MDIKDIQNLIKFVAKSGANEVKLEMGDVKITIKTGKNEKQTIVQAQPILQQPMIQSPIVEQSAPATVNEEPSSDTDENSKYIT